MRTEKVLAEAPKNEAAAELARLRWSRIPAEKRSEMMRQVRAATPFKKKLKKKPK